MANPRVSGEAPMKRIARYLWKYPQLVWKNDRGKSDEHVIDIFSHSDVDCMSTFPKIHQWRRDRR